MKLTTAVTGVSVGRIWCIRRLNQYYATDAMIAFLEILRS